MGVVQSLLCTRINYSTPSVGDIHDEIRKVGGDELVSRCNKPIWGLDSEGEANGAWRNFGVPNMWYMMGRFSPFSFGFRDDNDILLICLQATWHFVDSIRVTSHFVSCLPWSLFFLLNPFFPPPQKSRP